MMYLYMCRQTLTHKVKINVKKILKTHKIVCTGSEHSDQCYQSHKAKGKKKISNFSVPCRSSRSAARLLVAWEKQTMFPFDIFLEARKEIAVIFCQG